MHYVLYQSSQLDAHFQIEKLEREQGLMSDTGGIAIRAMPLPEGMTVTSAEVIASLNEHLVITLQVRKNVNFPCSISTCLWSFISVIISTQIRA